MREGGFSASVPVSVVVLTKNEEQNIGACLESIRWSSDVHVVDSGSSDSTVSIAEKFGARGVLHPFESFAGQRNWALDNLGFKHEWVLFLDADERSTEKFMESVSEAISKAGESTAGFYCCARTTHEGRRLRGSDSLTKWQFRLVRRGRARFRDFGHGQKEDGVRGELGYIKEPYLHYPLSKGWTDWFDRHNRYSLQDAAERLNAKVSFKDLLSTHASARNKGLKPLVSRLPCWPLIYFSIIYLLNLGFLDGRIGLDYCINLAHYEFMIQVKMRELARAGRKGAS